MPRPLNFSHGELHAISLDRAFGSVSVGRGFSLIIAIMPTTRSNPIRHHTASATNTKMFCIMNVYLVPLHRPEVPFESHSTTLQRLQFLCLYATQMMSVAPRFSWIS